MNDGFLRADQGLNRFLDQIFACLHEHLEPDVLRRAVFLNEAAVERELRVGRGRKADFDFLEAAFHERLKKLQFLADVHRHGECLVAISQIYAAPARRVAEDAVRPLPVGQTHRRIGSVFFRRIFEHSFLGLTGRRSVHISTTIQRVFTIQANKNLTTFRQ